MRGLDDSTYDPLVTITFPLDEEGEQTMGHACVQYVLYASGLATSERYVYGKGNNINSLNSAFLSQSHVNAVLKLVSDIGTSQVKPALAVKAIVMNGTATHNKQVARDYGQNIPTVLSMLRLMGGIRGDLEEHLKDAIGVAETMEQRRAGWARVFTEDDSRLFENQASQPNSDVSRLLGSDPVAFDKLFDDIGDNRFDGERAERNGSLLIFLDCKMGHQALIAQLNPQSKKIRAGVSGQLFRLLTFHQETPSGFDEFARYLKQNGAKN